MNTPVTLQFLGASGTVTGSKYMLEFGDKRLVVDAGMYQGTKELRRRNWEPFPVDASTISQVLVTHAHSDHTSYLPALVNQGFNGPIHLTEGTARLAEIVLLDAAKLQEQATRDAIRGGYSKHEHWQVIVGGLAPLVLGYILVMEVITKINEPYSGMPWQMINIFGWGMAGAVLLTAIILSLLPWRRDVQVDFDEYNNEHDHTEVN